MADLVGLLGGSERGERGREEGVLSTGVAVVVMFLAVPDALAGYSVGPNGQTFEVTMTPWGSIDQPQTIDFVVYLDELDREPYVWISESPQMDRWGLPIGVTAGGCSPYELIGLGQGRWACRESTILMRPGRTYYWWMDFRRLDTGDYFGQQRVSGPLSFTLVEAYVPPPEDEDRGSEGTASASSKTTDSAATLPSRAAYRGGSVKHTGLTDMVYRTMKQLGLPRTLAIACWNPDDWVSVLAAEGDTPETHETVLNGFWAPWQPRWLHLSPGTCQNAQQLIDTRRATSRRAGAISTVRHETLHAYGLKNEAKTNCYAVQLVRFAGLNLGLSQPSARSLSNLAVRSVRSRAPSGYWNASSCRDGGAWDLLDEPNLGA